MTHPNTITRLLQLKQTIADYCDNLQADIDQILVELGSQPTEPIKVPRGLHPNGRISPAIQQLRASYEAPTDLRSGQTYLALRDFFTTQDGEWTPTAKQWSIPEWATHYGKNPQFLEKGASQHLFGLVLDSNGAVLTTGVVQYKSPVTNDNRAPDKASGWTNIPIWNNYNPSHGDPKTWTWQPILSIPAVKVYCGGLPLKQHVSHFAVWQVHTA